MRRQTLRATPEMIRRAAGMFAPLSRPAVPPIAAPAKPADQHQLDIADRKPVERETIIHTK